MDESNHVVEAHSDKQCACGAKVKALWKPGLEFLVHILAMCVCVELEFDLWSRTMENGEKFLEHFLFLLIKDKYHDSTMETKERIAWTATVKWKSNQQDPPTNSGKIY